MIKGVMNKKVILISIDGMRPDGLKQCGNEYLKELEKMCSYTYNVRTVYPSITLPCHFSMTHSVPPERHGILTNDYVPQVRPVRGIFENVKDFGGVTAMFYGWHPLRDIAPAGSLNFANFIQYNMVDGTDNLIADEAIKTIKEYSPDFVFLYMVETDMQGHKTGWMSKEYLYRINNAINNVKKVIELFKDEYRIIITADHGGHERSHGSLMDEDMYVPAFLLGEEFKPNEELKDVSILDITPTIAKIMGVKKEEDWEGKPLF